MNATTQFGNNESLERIAIEREQADNDILRISREALLGGNHCPTFTEARLVVNAVTETYYSHLFDSSDVAYLTGQLNCSMAFSL